MQMTSPPFWLMMVSRAMAVLPVFRSPMINSRCPRPIGVIASIALMPVCRGCLTGWRAAIPGAIVSTGRRSVVTDRPLAVQRDCPAGSTTRPMQASPTGTDSNSPVV